MLRANMLLQLILDRTPALITIKEFDSSIMQLHPFANDCLARLWADELAVSAERKLPPGL